MATNEQAVALRTKQDAMIEAKFGPKGIELANLAQAKAFAMEIAESGIAPAGMKTPGAILLAMQTGMELGLSAMQALQSVVVVNGRATLMGTAAIALIETSGQLEPGTELEYGCARSTTDQELELYGSHYGFCRSQRKGRKPRETIFSRLDAEDAGLWGKAGPWKQYPGRMLMWRAIGFHFRDHWADIGHGLMIDVEARDIPRERDVTPQKLEGRPAAKDPLFEDVEIIDDRDEPQKVAVVTDPITGEVIDEIDPETGEVIPPGAGVVFDD